MGKGQQTPGHVRERVQAEWSSGRFTAPQIAERHDLGESTVRKFCKGLEKGGKPLVDDDPILRRPRNRQRLTVDQRRARERAKREQRHARDEYLEPSWKLGEVTPASFENPVRFGREVFGMNFYDKQIRALMAIDKPGARVAVRGCHGSGKTLVQAVASVHFPCKHGRGEAIDTAPTFKQVRGQIWKEIHGLFGSAAMKRKGAPVFEVLERTLFAPVRESKGYRYAVGETAEEESHFQGKHGTLLFNVNEAQAVGAHIFSAIDNNRSAGDIHEFRVGNTYGQDGAFHDSFHGQSHLWHTEQITVWDTPNLWGLDETTLLELSEDELDFNPWPTANRRWVKEKLELWGPSHPLWRVKCMAEFLALDQWHLISIDWLLAAEARDVGPSLEDGITAGIDAAGGGKDETACYALQTGVNVGELFTPSTDPRGQVMAWLKKLGGPEKVSVNGDKNGVGYYLLRFIEDAGYKVRDMHAQHAASDPDRFENEKAEMYWQLREAFENEQLFGITDPKTQSEAATIKWRLLPSGKTDMESKPEREKRGLKSPNRLEALAYANATRTRRRTSVLSGYSSDIGADSDERKFSPPLAGIRGKRW